MKASLYYINEKSSQMWRNAWNQISVISLSWQIVEEPNLKKCVIKGDNWSLKGPTKNLYILNAEVVLMTVSGGVFPNQWEYYVLP